MLCQHFNGLGGIHRWIKVTLQSLQVFIECLFVYAGLNKFGNTLNKFVRNKTDLLCPILPIKTVTALFHEFGIHAVLYLTKTKFQLSGNFCILNLLCFRFSIICTQARSAYGNRRCTGLFVRLLLVESYLVYHCVETVIV